MPKKAFEPTFDDESPEWTEADIARAAKFPNSVHLEDLKPKDLNRIVGKPKPPTTKKADW
jgi:predicted RNA-binding protein with PUA-like domain